MKLTQKLIIGFVVVIVLASGFKTIDKAKNGTLDQDKETKTSSETTEIASSSVDETTSETTEGTEATSNSVDEETMPASQSTETNIETVETTTEVIVEKEAQERADSEFSYDDFVRFYTDGDFSLVTPEFKTEMDEYEAFYDEYISFMQKYMSGSSNIIDMFEDYGEMIKRLEKWDEKIDAVDESKLTPADDAYFVYVTTRIVEKEFALLGGSSQETS